MKFFYGDAVAMHEHLLVQAKALGEHALGIQHPSLVHEKIGHVMDGSYLFSIRTDEAFLQNKDGLQAQAIWTEGVAQNKVAVHLPLGGEHDTVRRALLRRRALDATISGPGFAAREYTLSGKLGSIPLRQRQRVQPAALVSSGPGCHQPHPCSLPPSVECEPTLW